VHVIPDGDCVGQSLLHEYQLACAQVRVYQWHQWWGMRKGSFSYIRFAYYTPLAVSTWSDTGIGNMLLDPGQFL
jgi:hypothetical protein